MKIRNDFVSNSSSCSFVLVDPTKAAEFLAADFSLKYNDLSMSAPDVYCSVTCRKDKVEEVKTLFNAHGSYESVWSDDDTADMVRICEVDLGSILCAMMSADSSDTLTAVKEIYLSCDDYETATVMKLKALFDYFSSCDEKIVDASDSERGFDDCQSAFITALSMKTIERTSHK